MTTQLDTLKARFEEAKAENLDLDMRRGKPGPEQLDLSLAMLDLVTADDYRTATGDDPRNYGGLDGIPEMKSFFKEFLEVSSEAEVVIGGNSSLTLMHDTVARAMSHGVAGSEKPWGKLDKVKFICPSPGYDRHFAICEHFGIEMITVDIDADGPNMEQVEALVKADDSIKGIWVVPKYANPTGLTVSEEVVYRLANMTTAANDFRIFWDNAYAVHHLNEEGDALANILEACKAANQADRVFIFGSTSKITFAGSGVSAVAGSENNMEWLRGHLAFQTIGPDKLNQVRHMRFFKDFNGLKEHMKKHAAIIKPKFDAVLEVLERELGGKGLANWTNPNGGYFISLDLNEGQAKKVVALANELGVKLTGAGATFPYKNDPKDSNIRLAPTYPSIEEIKKAMEVVCLCVELAASSEA
ncbi:aminotransferase class I/II-fold pyridoxal phosphate-dependent enzyme [Algivirga pacifica]|uniref:Aminotransferase class I/II-fold pyridoxal phosphate-dependent enzyme n=1 Tax=Algivirga pacifica TaxID=1162670 RepID=A0ABP9DBB0_9BACT